MTGRRSQLRRKQVQALVIMAVIAVLIAYFYARHANKSLDPLATELREEFEQEAGR